MSWDWLLALLPLAVGLGLVYGGCRIEAYRLRAARAAATTPGPDAEAVIEAALVATGPAGEVWVCPPAPAEGRGGDAGRPGPGARQAAPAGRGR